MKMWNAWGNQWGICKSPIKTQEIAQLPMGYEVTGTQTEPTLRWVPVPGIPPERGFRTSSGPDPGKAASKGGVS